MFKRTITGAVYVLILLAFFLIRQFISLKLFNILIWLFTFIGTFELARAIKPFLLGKWQLVILFFGFIFIPHYYLFEYVILTNKGALFSLFLSILFIIITLIVGLVKKLKFKIIAVNILPFVYPALLLLTMCCCNDFGLEKGFIALLLIFVISPLADSFAYIVGSVTNKIKKGQAKKMCPILSPKKTWAGAIGGLFGGAVGSILVYLIFNFSFNLNFPVLFYIIVGILGSFADEIGDLFESYIKRKVNLKDMGKILPGHGGILDRIDGTMFTSLIIYIAFLLI